MLPVAASLWEARTKISSRRRRPEVSVFSHERLNLAYDTIEFVDEV
jgi:hypothetical protein